MLCYLNIILTFVALNIEFILNLPGMFETSDNQVMGSPLKGHVNCQFRCFSKAFTCLCVVMYKTHVCEAKGKAIDASHFSWNTKVFRQLHFLFLLIYKKV